MSAGCANCYAEVMSHRNPGVLGQWGPQGTRVLASNAQWREPLKWDRAAGKAGERRRVFCASLADVFEGPETMPAGAFLEVTYARERLFGLIDRTPDLDWLLLTKRPENIARMLPPRGLGDPDQLDVESGMDPEARWRRPNLWLGTSVEDQATADDRIPHLLKVPAAVRFLSVEPLLGPVDLRGWLSGCDAQRDGDCSAPFCPQLRDGEPALPGRHCPLDLATDLEEARPSIDWVIIGGESGPRSRDCHIGWVRDLVSQCRHASTACFVKQLGAAACDEPVPGYLAGLPFADAKGGDPAEWPEDLRVREFPAVKGR